MATTQDRFELADRLRGMHFGVAYGDALTRTGHPANSDTPTRTSVATQLLCVSTEGVLRSLVRESNHDTCHHPTIVWLSLARWGRRRGINFIREPEPSNLLRIEGWLSAVSELSEDRGHAPSVFRTLKMGEPGTVAQPINSSNGYQALLRILPTSAAWISDEFDGQLMNHFTTFTRDIAAQTHGATSTWDASIQLASLIRTSLVHQNEVSFDRLLRDASIRLREMSLDDADLTAAIEAYAASTANTRESVLARIAPDWSSRSALIGAVFCALTFDESRDGQRVMTLAASAPHPKSVAVITGAILGAAFGPEFVPGWALAGLDLAIVLDTLATDLATQLIGEPTGAFDLSLESRLWVRRYPGC